MSVFDGLSFSSVGFERGEKVFSDELPDGDPRKAILDDISEILGCPVSFTGYVNDPNRAIDVVELAKNKAVEMQGEDGQLLNA